MRPTRNSNHFILEAFDRDLWCPIAQTLFHVADVAALRAILGSDAKDDPELRNGYCPDDSQIAELTALFGVKFDRSEFKSADLTIALFRWRALNEAPYLIHTRYELPLLLNGRKKLARMADGYPPMTFDGEDRFDHWVAKGRLHKEVVLEPFDPIRGYVGVRKVYYTPKGEEWRIPACELIWEASSKAGGWNEFFERLEGMLFGYEDWQNDWWIDIGLQGGGFGGVTFCCPVTAAGLAWIEAAGLRALPPVEGPGLAIAGYDMAAKAELHALMLENRDHAAVVRFNVLGQHVRDIIDLRHGGPWNVQKERISELNRHLRGSIVIVAYRDNLVSSEGV